MAKMNGLHLTVTYFSPEHEWKASFRNTVLSFGPRTKERTSLKITIHIVNFFNGLKTQGSSQNLEYLTFCRAKLKKINLI